MPLLLLFNQASPRYILLAYLIARKRGLTVNLVARAHIIYGDES